MNLADSNSLLRGFGLARLGVAALLLAVGPALPAAAIVSPPVRDRRRQAAVTERTYRNAKIDRAPPVAATTAVTSAVSSRQTSHATR